MSATAADLHSYRVVGFWQSTNGKKVVMALTGVMMFLFVIGHLLGNLLVFAGRAQINAYAQFLHFDDSLLWIVRTILIIAATMHVVVTIQLALRNKEGATDRLSAQEGDQFFLRLTHHVLERPHRSNLHHLSLAAVHCRLHPS